MQQIKHINGLDWDEAINDSNAWLKQNPDNKVVNISSGKAFNLFLLYEVPKKKEKTLK